KENILLPLILDGKSPKKYEQKLNELVDYLKIKDLLNAMPTKLSGGEQQRVAIARALIYEPRIIFLDEPTGNLDSKNSTEIMNLLKKINQELNTTILQVTHSEENASYGNRIIRINDGLIVEDIVIETRSTEENETAIEEQNNAEIKVEEKTEIEE
ncbi:MAG: ATP-binding cassette domain-containing protein, partial [Clostridia bacterium]|nr:ATP-binding cassette domain-containing protein [Clostridia bacterium]